MKRVNGASDRARSGARRADRRNLRDRFYCTVLPGEKSLIEVRAAEFHERVFGDRINGDKGSVYYSSNKICFSILPFFPFVFHYSDMIYV